MELDPTRDDRAHTVDLLVVGEINPDVIVSGENVEPVFGQVETLVDSVTLTMGSSSVLTACGATRLGVRTAFVGAVGDDLFGRYMLGEMALHGIDTGDCVIDPERSTGVSVLLHRGADRAILTVRGVMADYRAEQVPDGVLRRARHLHVGSYYLQPALQPGLPALFAAAHAAGATTSVDCNWNPQGRWDGIAELLPVTDILLLNSREAENITGHRNPSAAAAALRDMGDDLVVAVKLGAEGGLLRNRDGEWHAKALEVEVVDTTGAGDSFDAGFLYGWLNAWDPLRSLRLAVTCGSLSTSQIGGAPGQPTLADALRYMSDAD
ncbi:carbohydrate kinase family protein [Nocardia sp. NPDC057663]|uniref:carbohydrate kinase family protein n=1 Tax=Nocardia sp. NPDC057663 TaxID=3346201 RepID=UPI00366D03A4